MSNDYTLPPVPAPDFTDSAGIQSFEKDTLFAYGHACAEHVRAPLAEENARLLARIAELEAEVGRLSMGATRQRQTEATWLAVREQNDRLRAEVEALRRPLTDEEIAFCIFEARKEAGPLLRNGTLSFRIARAVEKAHLDAVGAPWVNPLAAEVEALKLELAAERAASVIEWEPGRSYTAADLLRRVIANATPRKRDMLWPDVMKLCGVGSTVAHYLCRWAGRDPDTGKAIAARKGAALTTSNKGTPSE
jgi:hypothetical protein